MPIVAGLPADHGIRLPEAIQSYPLSLVLMTMTSRRIALVTGTLLGLIAIVAWITQIDLVFEESAEEQAPSQKSLIVEEASSGENPSAD